VVFPFTRTVSSPDETKKLASEFSEIINPGIVVVLNGELGSGKTFFVKEICKNWGITNVSSPSFAIVNNYSNSRSVYHFDFYRIKKKEELFDIGFNDYINNKDAVIFIEWGNLINEILPKERIQVNIKIIDDLKRKFVFEKLS